MEVSAREEANQSIQGHRGPDCPPSRLRLRTMNYMRLLKLLYIADRELFRATGRPIVWGSVLAM